MPRTAESYRELIDGIPERDHVLESSKKSLTEYGISDEMMDRFRYIAEAIRAHKDSDPDFAHELQQNLRETSAAALHYIAEQMGRKITVIE